MDRKTLDELRTREARPSIGMADCVKINATERDALFAYIDSLERENRKMLEALED